MGDAMLAAYVWQRTWRTAAWQRACRDERGEGVISASIAVLVMAFLGALMWLGFKATLGEAQGNVDDQITKIGQ
jgi:hypothetical protein